MSETRVIPGLLYERTDEFTGPLYDDGIWQLVRIDDPDICIFRPIGKIAIEASKQKGRCKDTKSGLFRVCGKEHIGTWMIEIPV